MSVDELIDIFYKKKKLLKLEISVLFQKINGKISITYLK